MRLGPEAAKPVLVTPLLGNAADRHLCNHYFAEVVAKCLAELVATAVPEWAQLRQSRRLGSLWVRYTIKSSAVAFAGVQKSP